MLTKKGYTDLLGRIQATGGETADMSEDLKRLESELDERDGMLARFGETYDGESDDMEWDFVAHDIVDYKDQYHELLEKYNGLSARFRDTMVNGHTPHEDETAVDEGEDDYVEPLTVDDLITEKEED